MLRYTFQYNNEKIVLTGSDSPVNVNDFAINLSRSSTFHSVIRSYSVGDKIGRKGKAWIDSIIKKYGWNINISVTVEWNHDYVWETIIENGHVGLSNLKQNQDFTEIDIEDGSFQAKVMNRADVDINYYSLETVDGNEITDYVEIETGFIYRGLNNENKSIKAIRPKYLFERIINSISGLDNRTDCSLFDTQPFDGSLALRMFTRGEQLRGFETNTFSISLNDFFKSLDATNCLGMGFETIDGKTKAIIEKRRYFFSPIVICEIENIKDLEYSWADEYMISQIVAGYANFNKKDNDYGQSEYNNKATYSTPLTQFKKKLDIISPVRADATSIQQLVDQWQLSKKNDLDDDNFMIDCVRDENENIVNRKLEGLSTNPSGIYAELELYTNMLLSPARMINEHGQFLATGFQFDKDKYLKVQKTETFSQLSTTKIGEANPVTDGVDILINNLGLPFLTGRIVKFNATFGISKLILIKNSSNGLIKFYDYINKKFNFAYIKELQTKLLDKEHNFEGLEAVFTEEDENVALLLDESGLPILQENGLFIQLEKNMLASSKISNLANLASLPDDAMVLLAYNDSNYYQTGAQLKQNLAFDIDGAQAAILLPDQVNSVVLGNYNTTKNWIVFYKIKRGDRFRSATLNILSPVDNEACIFTETGLILKPDTFAETCGISIACVVQSEQVVIQFTVDDSDAENSEITYMITQL